MFCPNCGTQNPETAQTCSKCSFALKSAAPKFKGTMLMMNQGVAGIPGAPGGPGGPPLPGAPAQAPDVTPQSAPPAGTAGAVGSSAAQARLKGTIVGVAPPNVGGARGPAAPPMSAPGAGGGGGFGAPAPGAEQKTFGSPQGVNPLGGTMAVDGSQAAALGLVPSGAGAEAPPAFGAPPPAEPYGAPAGGGFGGGGPYGAPPAQGGGQGFGGAPPAQQDFGGFGASPPGGAPGGGYGAPAGGGYGAPTGGGYGAPAGGGYGGPPPGQADFGGPPPGGYPMGGQPGFGDPNQAMQPYPGGPMMTPGGMPGPLATGEQKSWMVTLLLCLFAGTLGAHRFYTGHIGIGIGQLLTLGGCGIWALVDLVFILTGKFTDKAGRPLSKQ